VGLDELLVVVGAPGQDSTCPNRSRQRRHGSHPRSNPH
jgi:hypothetical protein